jgi:hypothetical protein
MNRPTDARSTSYTNADKTIYKRASIFVTQLTAKQQVYHYVHPTPPLRRCGESSLTFYDGSIKSCCFFKRKVLDAYNIVPHSITQSVFVGMRRSMMVLAWMQFVVSQHIMTNKIAHHNHRSMAPVLTDFWCI